MGDVHDRDVARVGQRMTLAAGAGVRCVVLEVDRGEVGSGPAAGPATNQLRLVRSLQHDDVERLVPQLLGRQLAHRGGPVPGAGAADAVGAAVRQHRDDVVVRALDERRRPAPVHVPEQDPHRRLASNGAGSVGGQQPDGGGDLGRPTPTTGTGARRSDRRSTGCPGTARPGHRAARPVRRRAPSARAGTTGANSETTGVPTAADEVAGPGVGDHGDLRPVEHRGQLRKVEPTSQVENAGRRQPRPPQRRSAWSAAARRHSRSAPPASRPGRAGPPPPPRAVPDRPAPAHWSRGGPRPAVLGSRTAAPHRGRAVGGVRGAGRHRQRAARSRPRVRSAASGPAPAHRRPPAAGRRAASRDSPRSPRRSCRTPASRSSRAVGSGDWWNEVRITAWSTPQPSDPVDQVVDLGTTAPPVAG